MATQHTVTSMSQQFGPFQVAFRAQTGSVAHYLRLLNLGQGAAESINAVRRAAGRRGAERRVIDMLRDRNWRPHLVAIVAAFETRPTDALAECWRALDRGSWVAPQIAAVLSIIDADFLSNSLVRLRAGCPLVLDSTDEFDSRVLALASQEPGRPDFQTAKNSASLLALLALDHRDDEGVLSLTSDAVLADLIRRDVDKSAEICIGWRTRFVSLWTGGS
jgi:hypothetical protein